MQTITRKCTELVENIVLCNIRTTSLSLIFKQRLLFTKSFVDLLSEVGVDKLDGGLELRHGRGLRLVLPGNPLQGRLHNSTDLCLLKCGKQFSFNH